jgi:hypothetical protein
VDIARQLRPCDSAHDPVTGTSFREQSHEHEATLPRIGRLPHSFAPFREPPQVRRMSRPPTCARSVHSASCRPCPDPARLDGAVFATHHDVHELPVLRTADKGILQPVLAGDAHAEVVAAVKSNNACCRVDAPGGRSPPVPGGLWPPTRTSGSSWAMTGFSPTACSTLLMPFSITAATVGTSWRHSRGPSYHSACAIGSTGSNH